MAKKFKCPYTFPHRSRRAMLEYIDTLDYYSRGLRETWPLCFNVKLHSLDLSFDHLWGAGAKEHMPATVKARPALQSVYMACVREQYDRLKDGLWDIAVESARENVTEGDTHQSLWDGTLCRTKFGFTGRSGGYLVVEEWNGWSFVGKSRRELLEIFSDSGSVGYKELPLFYKFCRHWEKDFARSNAVSEVEYQAAFRIFTDAEESWEEQLKKWQAEQGVPLIGRRIRVRNTAGV